MKNIFLVAADGRAQNPRVLATSTPKGNLASLSVPPDIKLSEGERLYFGFDSKEKPCGPLKVRVLRSK